MSTPTPPLPHRKRLSRVTALTRRKPSTARKVRQKAGKAATWDGWLKIGAVIAAIGVFGSIWSANHSLDETRKSYQIASRTEITTRFAKAIEQIGTDRLEIKLGGIHLLEKLVTDSPEDSETIYQILTEFVRTHAPTNEKCSADYDASEAFVAVDVQAALTVIGKRQSDSNLNLENACLPGAVLAGANLRHVNLDNTNLFGASLKGADLSWAHGHNTSAPLANFSGARMFEARFDRPNFKLAQFEQADLTRTRFVVANCDTCTFFGAKFDDSFWRQVDIRGARFAYEMEGTSKDSPSSSTPEQLNKIDAWDIRFDDTTRFPKGFIPSSRWTMCQGPSRPTQMDVC
ncbi:pentapeptide repeat-containing protein [Nocardia colli]|uniref:pentapeptide repeat-containing protein n=1 Tax=Nocardia colli TaxID=2545717 RepID=UPI0035DFF9C0